MGRSLLAGFAACLAAAAPTARADATLDGVRAAKSLACGIVTVPEDYNKQDLHGPLAPLGTEICKAVAVAALGPDAAVELRPYASEMEAETGLHASQVALVAGLTPTATGAWHWQLGFGPPYFFDALGILVRKDVEATSLADLAHRKVCVVEGTDNEPILLAATVARGIPINPLPFQEEGEMEDGLAVGHCDAVAADLSALARIRVNYPKQLGGDLSAYLPETLLLSPVAPAYRAGDPQWALIVDYTVHALVEAEVLGVTQANAAAMRDSADPRVQRLLGADWAVSRALGLDAHDWAARVIASVGNYGEVYDRTVGAHGRLGLPRGLNALWTEGGLMQAPPFQ